MTAPKTEMDLLTLQAGDLEPLAVNLAKAAGMVGVSKRSLENYAAQGLLETRKLGRRRVVLVSSLKKFLRADRPSVSPARRDQATAKANRREVSTGATREVRQ